MSARDRAQTRTLPIDFNSQSEPRRPEIPHKSQSGRGFTLAQSTNTGGPSRRDMPQQQQIAQPPPMVPAQAAQQRRQIQADRQDEIRRRKAFVTTLTGSARDEVDGTAPPDSGYNTPREDVDDVTAE